MTSPNLHSSTTFKTAASPSLTEEMTFQNEQGSQKKDESRSRAGSIPEPRGAQHTPEYGNTEEDQEGSERGQEAGEGVRASTRREGVGQGALRAGTHLQPGLESTPLS